MLGSMSPIAPPSATSAQELKELFALVSDFSKSKAALDQIAEGVSRLEGLKSGIDNECRELAKREEALRASEGALVERDKKLVEREEKIDAVTKNLSAVSSANSKKEIELKLASENLEREKAAYIVELESRERGLSDLQKKCEEKLAQANAMISEHLELKAKLNSILGG